MRILHVIENLNTGGAEHMLINLVSEQVRRQHQVAVLCLFAPGDLAGTLAALDVPVTACYKNRGLSWAVLGKMLGTVRAFAPDVVHSHSLMGNYYLAFIRLLVASRAIQIVTRHGLLREGSVRRLGLLFHLSLWMTHWAVGVCDAVSEELLIKHARFSKRIVTINNGVDLARFKLRNAQSHAALQAELKLPSPCRLLGIVARLNPVKNHRLLLEAFAVLNKHYPHSALVIVGDGAIREALEQLAKALDLSAAVFFLGDRSDVHELLAGIDVFVLSSDNEGYSLALLEAAAARLPLVATDVGGNSDIVQHGQTGLLVPPQDSVALAGALLTLVTDSQQADRLGDNARTWVEQNASLAAMADAYERLYQGKA